MKNLTYLFALVILSIGCNPKHSTANQEPPKLTILTLEQVEKLLPYMVDLKKQGNKIDQVFRSEIDSGRVMVQHQRIQSYTFSILVDENDKPVLPDSVSAMRRPPVRQNGTFEVRCIGGCVPNTSGGPACEIHGCETVDNACGCTPIDCPGCESVGCIAGGNGVLTGGVIMF